MPAQTNVDLQLPRVATGKVREIFELDSEHLLFVATDRISAYDVVMAQGIPSKGRVLTELTRFWLDLLSDVCPNHLAEAKRNDVPPEVGGRAMVVRRLEMLPVEFVVRGYLVGSGWKDYQATGAVCGIPLPSGLQQGQQLPEPIFTPATKAQSGHDENISEDIAADLAGPDRLKTAKQYAIEMYRRAAEYAAERGIILADTKFEFGMLGDKVILGDEVLTPDSSRFWPADQWSVGANPPSFDKQYLRDWLDSTGWNHEPPPPDLPDGIVQKTADKYLEAYERLTGSKLSDQG